MRFVEAWALRLAGLLDGWARPTSIPAVALTYSQTLCGCGTTIELGFQLRCGREYTVINVSGPGTRN